MSFRPVKTKIQIPIRVSVFFMYHLEIKYGTSGLTAALRAVNCIVTEALAVREEARRGWRSGQKLPALQAVSNFWAPQEGCHRFELRLALLSITLLSLRDISPIRGITCLRRYGKVLLKKCYFNKAYNRLKAVDKQNDPCYYYEKFWGGKRYVLYHYPTQTKIACIL